MLQIICMKPIRRILALVTMPALAMATANVSAAVMDDFESYAVGSNLHGQDSWSGWDNSAGAGAQVSNLQAASGSKSVRIAVPSDLVRTFSGVSGGQWTFGLKQYIPSSAGGSTWIILMNTYNVGGPYDWSVQLLGNITAGTVTSENGYPGNTIPMVKDAWVDLRFDIDLGAGLVSEYYNNQLVSTHPWHDATGVNALAALDLYADAIQTGAVFYDDLTLFTPTVPSVPAQGLWGNALSFDGQDDYVRSLSDVALSNRSFSVEAWVQRRSSDTIDMVVSQGSGGYNRCLMFGFHYYAGNQFVFDFYGNGVESGTVDTDTAWHHWAGTYDASTKRRCLYRDGVLIASNTNTAEHYQGSGPIKIGVGPGGEAPNQFDGQIEDVRIWNVACSQSDIAARMGHPLSGTESNLLAYWPLDEGSDIITRDASGHGYAGTLVNGPQWIPSPLPWGNAVSLNGTNQYVAMPAGVWFSNDFTIEAWVYVRSHKRWGRLIDFGNGAPSDNVLLTLSQGTTGQPMLQTYPSPTWYSVPELPTNRWVHLAATLQGTTATFFYDGVPQATNTVQPPNPVRRTNNYIGRSNWAADDYADAIFEDLRIWNVARSPGQIREGMCHPLSGTETNLAGYWKFDSVTGTNAPDATANHNDGVLFNGPGWVIPAFLNATPWFTPGLPGVHHASVAWGDYDNDGRLDFLLTGSSNDVPSGAVAQVWRNTGSGFSNVTATVAPALPGVAASSVAWGDYDNDGRLDFLLTGDTGSGRISQVWRNTGSGFANVAATVPPGLPGVNNGSAAWGDYDNNGRLDLLLTGWGGSDGVSQVWRNIGWPTNTPLVTGDLNGDGVVNAADLAILLARLNGNGSVNSSDFAAVLARLNGNGAVTQADLDLVLSNYWPHSPWLSLINLAGLGTSNVTFALTNSTAGAFSVEASTNLTDWEFLGPATPRYEFTDTNAPAVPQRSYRLRWP